MTRWLDRADEWLDRHRVLVGIAAVVFVLIAAVAFGRPGPG